MFVLFIYFFFENLENALFIQTIEALSTIRTLKNLTIFEKVKLLHSLSLKCF